MGCPGVGGTQIRARTLDWKGRRVPDSDAIYFPPCQRCDIGTLVPFSDFGGQGAAIHYKAWVCTNEGCGYNLKIRNGEVYIDEPIVDGSQRAVR